MPVKLQKHLLKAVGGVVLTRYHYMHFHSIEAWKKSMLKVKNVKKCKKLEMCQYDTDAPAQGHPHPHAGILQKLKLKKGP